MDAERQTGNPRQGRIERVLMTADAVGGVWTYSVDLSRSLVAEGVEVLLAVMGPPPDEKQLEETATIPLLKVVSRPCSLEWFERVSDHELRAAGEWLLSLSAEFKPSVVHLNGYCHASLDWRAPVLVVAHSCVTSWWAAVNGTKLPQSWQPYRRRVKEGLLAASAIVAPSHSMLAALEQAYDLHLPEGRVIYNSSCIKSADCAEKQHYIFACGRVWDKAKNYCVLDRATSRLSWPVTVAGDFVHPQGKKIESENLQLMGSKSRLELEGLFRRASIFAHPAKYEPFGLAVLEAARNRCALVLADIPSMREIWQDNALFVSPDKPESWTFALNALIESPALRDSLADRACRHSALYSPQTMADQYFRLYEALTAFGRSAALSDISYPAKPDVLSTARERIRRTEIKALYNLFNK